MHPKFTLGQSRFASDERAVTPVVSLVLVVALTMILGALVGSSTFGIADQNAKTAPTMALHSHWVGLEDADPDNDRLVLEHQSGNALETARLSIYVDGNPVYEGGNPEGGASFVGWDADVVSAGDSIEITGPSGSGFTGQSFTVYYEMDDKSFVLAEN